MLINQELNLQELKEKKQESEKICINLPIISIIFLGFIIFFILRLVNGEDDSPFIYILMVCLSMFILCYICHIKTVYNIYKINKQEYEEALREVKRQQSLNITHINVSPV
jgi:predicted ABC-type exoprotein transport system permease subunit